MAEIQTADARPAAPGKSPSTLGVCTQIESECLQPMTPPFEVGLGRVAFSGIAREASRNDQLRARPQELETRLVTDLHAPAGQQRHSASQIRELRALGEVELRAGGTHLIVKVMDHRIFLLADVAVRAIRLIHIDSRRCEFLRAENNSAS